MFAGYCLLIYVVITLLSCVYLWCCYRLKTHTCLLCFIGSHCQKW